MADVTARFNVLIAGKQTEIAVDDTLYLEAQAKGKTIEQLLNATNTKLDTLLLLVDQSTKINGVEK